MLRNFGDFSRLLAFTVALATWLAAQPLVALADNVQFDVPAIATAQDITDSDFSWRNPGEKLISLPIPFSVLVPPSSQGEVESVLVTIESAASQWQVVDYFPKTSVETSFAGNVAVQTREENRFTLDFDAAGNYKALTGAFLTGNYHDAHQSAADFQLLPPKELATAAGTTQRGRGVYFKWKAHSQTTVEGAKDLLLIVQVPTGWRADVLRVRCEAHGRGDGLLGAFEDSLRLGRQEFLLATYLRGDTAAHRSAERFLQAQRNLVTLAAAQQRSIDRQATPKLLRKVGISAPSLPSNWLNNWLYGPTNEEALKRLPESVKQAAIVYAQSRALLRGLNGETVQLASRITSQP